MGEIRRKHSRSEAADTGALRDGASALGNRASCEKRRSSDCRGYAVLESWERFGLDTPDDAQR